MKAFSLSKELCPDRIPVLPGKYLGDGADGDVYLIANSPDKVIKFVVLYEGKEDIDRLFLHRMNVLSYLQNNPHQSLAEIFSYGYLGFSYRNQIRYDSKDNEYIYKQKYILYYYIMERLLPISEDEKKVFYSSISHRDMGDLRQEYSIMEIENAINDMASYLVFDKSKAIDFCKNIIALPFNHRDIHERNIMKDKSGNFKLIDFDRTSLYV